MKHWVYWLIAIAAGALAVMGCGGVAPPKPADPPAADPPAPTAAKYSCGDGYVFDGDQVPGPEGAVVNDVFYWGSSTSGAARCFSDTRNNSMVGVGSRVESNAGDATGATVMSVTLPDERRWYFILEFSDGTYCSAATAGDGRAACFATVERDATGFRLDDLPAVTLPVPAGAPEPPLVEDPPEPPVGNTQFRWGRIEEVTTDQRRWYLILGYGPGEIVDGRDDGVGDPACIAATAGDGKVTCTATTFQGNGDDKYTTDDLPASTSPQSSEGTDAIDAYIRSFSRQGGLWYLVLESPDGTFCSAATAGDGKVTCTSHPYPPLNGDWVPPGGPGPGGGDGGGGQTGAPEPEDPQPVGNTRFRWGRIEEVTTDQRRWYLILGYGPGEIVDGRDDGVGDPACIAATAGDGKVTCTATTFQGNGDDKYTTDDLPASTSPQSSEGTDAIAAIVGLRSSGLDSPGQWYLILEFSDGTFCSTATAGDGIVTCTSHPFPPPYP